MIISHLFNPGLRFLRHIGLLLLTAAVLDVSAIEVRTIPGDPGKSVSITLPGESAGAVSSAEEWIKCEVTSASAPIEIKLTLDASNLSPGSYEGTVTVMLDEASQDVPVSLTVDPFDIWTLVSSRDTSMIYGLVVVYRDVARSETYLLEIDSLSESILRVVGVDNESNDLAIHEDDNRLYLACPTVVRAVDLETLKEVDSPITAPSEWGAGDPYFSQLLAGRTGRLVIVSSEANETVLYDTESGDRLAVLGGRYDRGDFGPNKRYYYRVFSSSLLSLELLKFDTFDDTFTEVRRSESYHPNFKRPGTLVSKDGTRISAGSMLFDENLNEILALRETNFAISDGGTWIFGDSTIYDNTGAEGVNIRSIGGRKAYNSATQKVITVKRSQIRFYDFSQPTSLQPPNLLIRYRRWDKVELEWTNSSLWTRFTVQYRAADDIEWTTHATAIQHFDGAHLMYQVPFLMGTTYQLRVRSEFDELTSEWSEVLEFTTEPETPRLHSSIAAESYTILLDWTVAGTAYDSFELERSIDGGTTWEALAVLPGDAREYTDSDIIAEQTYHYRVRSGIGGNRSSYSATVDETSIVIVPPSRPSIDATVESATSVTVWWFFIQRAEKLRLEYRELGDTEWLLAVQFGEYAESYRHYGLTQGVTYEYRLRASNVSGDSSYSLPTQITIPPMTTVVSEDFSSPMEREDWVRIQNVEVAPGGGSNDSPALWFKDESSIMETTALSIPYAGTLRFRARNTGEINDWSGLESPPVLRIGYMEEREIGSIWRTLFRAPVQPDGVWRDYATDLPEAADLRLSFSVWFLTEDLGGWAIDDIEVIAPPPQAPPNVWPIEMSMPEEGTIRLSWKQPSSAPGLFDPEGTYHYLIERQIGQASWQEVAFLENQPAPEFIDSNLEDPYRTTYRITTVTSWGESAPLTIWSPLEEWRIEHFGTLDNAGKAADYATDRYGVRNLDRYAYGMKVGTAPRIFDPQRNTPGFPLIHFNQEQRWEFEFQRRKTSSLPGVDYIVEYSTDLQHWKRIDDPASAEDLVEPWERVVYHAPTLDSADSAQVWARVGVVSLE